MLKFESTACMREEKNMLFYTRTQKGQKTTILQLIYFMVFLQKDPQKRNRGQWDIQYLLNVYVSKEKQQQ